jgi:RimJ/RimL family protein N-acetyltransferase
MRNPFLIGEKIYLRPIEEADAATCYPWFSDPEVRAHLGVRAFPNNEQGSRDWIRKVDGRSHQMFALITRAEGAYVGNCDIFKVNLADRNAELAIAIGRKEYWGKGLGREAMRLLCHHAFRTLNLHRVFLRVYATNERAVRCYASVGFKPEGRLREDAYIDGRYVDTIFMGLLRGEHTTGG